MLFMTKQMKQGALFLLVGLLYVMQSKESFHILKITSPPVVDKSLKTTETENHRNLSSLSPQLPHNNPLKPIFL